MPKAIQEFYRFPVYQTREQYDSQPGDNADAPPWDGTRILQHWVDPKPANVLEFGNVKLAVYDAALQMLPNGTFAVDAKGQPLVSRMAIPHEHAISPNFLPPGNRVPTATDLGGGPSAEAMVANGSRSQGVPLALPEGARVRFAAGLQTPVVYLAGEALPEEQGAAAQAATLGQVLAVVNQVLAAVNRIAARVGA